MQKMSECKKCKNPGVDNAQTNFRMWLNDNKSAHKSFETNKRGTKNLFQKYYV